MRIIESHPPNRRICVDTLPPGTPFKYAVGVADHLYMRVAGGEGGMVTAVDLASGIVVDLLPSLSVIPHNASVLDEGPDPAWGVEDGA